MDTRVKRIETPLSDESCRDLQVGESVLISGVIYTARDAAHKRMVESLNAGEPLPFDIKGQIVYYVGPCPAPPGYAIGPAGPTTSGRMDSYTPAMLDAGLKGMLGKGLRSKAVVDSMVKNTCVYLATTGGAGALLAKRVVKSDLIAYPDLGPEAVYRLVVKDFPAVVAIDCCGRDIYTLGVAEYRKS